MIQTYTWEVVIPDSTKAGNSALVPVVEGVGKSLMNKTSFCLGTGAAPQDGSLFVTLRVSGKDRWAAQAHAKQLGEQLFRSARMWQYKITHISTINEPNRRGLKTGEGRTPRPRPPKAFPNLMAGEYEADGRSNPECPCRRQE